MRHINRNTKPPRLLVFYIETMIFSCTKQLKHSRNCLVLSIISLYYHLTGNITRLSVEDVKYLSSCAGGGDYH